NPVATAVGWRFFVQALLRRLCGQARERPFKARLKTPLSKTNGLYQFMKARLEVDVEGVSAEVLDGQESFRLRPLADSHGYVALPEAARDYVAGEVVNVFTYGGDTGLVNGER